MSMEAYPEFLNVVRGINVQGFPTARDRISHSFLTLFVQTNSFPSPRKLFLVLRYGGIAFNQGSGREHLRKSLSL